MSFELSAPYSTTHKTNYKDKNKLKWMKLSNYCLSCSARYHLIYNKQEFNCVIVNSCTLALCHQLIATVFSSVTLKYPSIHQIHHLSLNDVNNWSGRRWSWASIKFYVAFHQRHIVFLAMLEPQSIVIVTFYAFARIIWSLENYF